MRNLKAIALGLFMSLVATGAFAQCGTQAPANKFCGNDTGSQALATWKSVPAGALSAIGPGTVLGNPSGASAVPVATSTPILGVSGTTQGTLTLYGGTSGAVLLVPQAAAGSPVLTFPNTSGTFAIGATAPLALSATTGTLSITGIAGTVLAGAGPVFTMTPALGANGVATGSLAFNGFTSGSVVLTPQSAAGTPVVTLPNTSGTIAVGATSPLVLSATTGTLTCPTCVTPSTGAALTKTDDTNVTLTLGGTPTTALVNAASLTLGWTGQLSLTRGGSNASLTASNGGIIYSTASAMAVLAGTATANQHLASGASGAPSWTTATYPATAGAGTILNAASSNVISATATPTLGANGGTGGQITLSGSTSGSGVIRVAAAAGAGIIFQLPSSNGSSTNVLTTNGSGVTSWSAAGTGDVVGPGSSTDNAAARFDSTTGKLIQNSALIIADTTGALSRSGGGGIQQQGTNTNDNAAAGEVSEYIEHVGSPVALTSNVAAELATITLTAGDWNITAGFIGSGTGTTTSNDIWASINTTTAVNVNTAGQASRYRGATLTDPIWAQSIGPLRVSISGSTTYYCNGQAQIGASTLSMNCKLTARRAR